MSKFVNPHHLSKAIHFCTATDHAANVHDGVSMFEKLLNTDKDPEICLSALRLISYYLENIRTEFSNLGIDFEQIYSAINVALSQAHFELPDCARVEPVLFERHGDNDHATKITKYVYRCYATQALTLGSWLRNISSPSTNHLDYVSLLHELHYQFTGADKNGISLLQRVDRLFEEHGVDLTILLSSLRRAGAETTGLLLTNLYLAAGLFPRTFTPEILGITLFETLHTPVGLKFIDANESQSREYLDIRNSGYFADLENLFACFLPDNRASLALSAITKYLASIPDALRTEHRERVSKGYLLAFTLRQQFLTQIQCDIQSGRLTSHQEMLALIQRKAKHAVGYHSKVRVNLKPLDKLLADNPEDVLHHLAKSKYIKPGSPETSRLCNKSIAFGGPMFRIFDEQELDIIKNWINSLPANDRAEATGSCPINFTRSQHKLTPQQGIAQLKVVEDFELPDDSIRSLYYHFLNIEFFPGLLPKANSFAEFWLNRCSYRLETGDCALPFTEYTHAKLNQWFDELAHNQLLSYDDRKNEAMSKDRLKNASLQLCPMIFIDGAWLQKAGEPTICRSKIGTILSKIYSDEVGNGKQEWNHPNLYRQLMADMSFELPDFDDEAFANFSDFDDDAFLVPVFWLSISLFPTRYFPELLGLNLAMELSGVGGSYRVARDQLKHHGFSTLFVDLHNTIDNVSSGHSAMALDAIKIYLDDISVREGSSSVEKTWKRIWVGYRALVPPKGMSNFIYASIVGKKHKQKVTSNLSKYEGEASLV